MQNNTSNTFFEPDNNIHCKMYSACHNPAHSNATWYTIRFPIHSPMVFLEASIRLWITLRKIHRKVERETALCAQYPHACNIHMPNGHVRIWLLRTMPKRMRGNWGDRNLIPSVTSLCFFALIICFKSSLSNLIKLLECVSEKIF